MAQDQLEIEKKLAMKLEYSYSKLKEQLTTRLRVAKIATGRIGRPVLLQGRPAPEIPPQWRRRPPADNDGAGPEEPEVLPAPRARPTTPEFLDGKF